ncbi:MAG TPA: lysylphosphatidylglycerol synthase domain-containing protein [Acidimicrobiales bacterium]|nr:lysylphosphatidylglycerol synthase domain-containing protein [Acidimicrobiales bacterium]
MTPNPRAEINRSSRLVASPLAVVGIAAPIVLERRYRLLVDALVRLRRSRRGRWSLAAGSGATMVVLAFLAAQHFATSPWPLSGGHPGVLVAICLLLLLAQGFKAWGWGRLFTANERPRPLALAAGNGGAALTGVVLPGRFDDAMRIAVVRRYPGCRAGVRALCLSLIMLGLIDSVALAPLAAAAAVLGGGIGVRVGLTIVALAGVAAACLLVALPRLAGSERALRFRLGRWLSPRTTSRRLLSEAWALVSACWLLRALASFLLLGTLGVGFSLPLALLFLCAGAAAAAVPIGPAGAATQVGAGAAALIASGVGGSQALAVTLAGGALGVLTGAAIFVATIVWRVGLSVATSRIGTSGST